METALEYLRDYVKISNIPEEWYEFEIAEMMRDYATYYHEQQVKSVDLADVVGQSEQLKCDCCNGTGMVEGDYRDELESCLICNGRGTF